MPAPNGPDLLLPSFRVRTTGVVLTLKEQDILRKSLEDVLGNSGQYHRIGTTVAGQVADTLQVEVLVDLQTKYTWWIAWPGIYPMPGYWPVQPYEAVANVSLTARGSVGAQAFRHDASLKDSHSEQFYGFFRKTGVSEMLSRAYDDLFLGLRDKVATQRAAASQGASANLHKIRNIAVMPLEAPGLETSVQRVVTDQLVTEFLNKGRYQVLEREQIDRILQEQGFQQSGACDTEGCLVQVGQLLGVDAMVSGSISRIGKLHVVSVRVTDVQDGRILFASQVQTEDGIAHLLGTELRGIAEKF